MRSEPRSILLFCLECLSNLPLSLFLLLSLFQPLAHVCHSEITSDPSFSPTISNLLFPKCHLTIFLKKPETTANNLSTHCELFQDWGFILLTFVAPVFRKVGVN